MEYEIYDYKYENSPKWDNLKNKNFQVIAVKYCPEKIPFLSKKNAENLKDFEIYCRRSTSSDIARQEDINKIVNNRINNPISKRELNLKKELKELEILSSYNHPLKNLFYRANNPNYLETVEKFEKMKIKLIEKELGIDNISDD